MIIRLSTIPNPRFMISNNIWLIRNTRYLVIILLLIITSVRGYPQGSDQLFAVVDFLKVEPGKFGEYLNLEQEVWKPMHQERLDRGKIVGWYLYAINFTGANDEYNYAVINLYSSLDSLENPWDADILSVVHPDKSRDQIMEKTRNARVQVRSELYYPIVNLPVGTPLIPSAYLLVGFMQVEPYQGPIYEELETDIWQPVQKSLIEDNITTSWNVWRVVFPRGADRSYQYVVMDGVSLYSYTFGIPYQENFAEVHPGEDIKHYQDRTADNRTVARTELWELIDYIIK